MHIIGTAGHVDHGKTALIEALTGINADRLPEEKKRGMTIDLGFAHFTGPDGEPIGVIDVPGHERFIRNMVAGAWSLSCALLVIAGDDGWMQQTEDHARVLEAMGINNIICCITKTDIVDSEILTLVSEEARENCLKIFGRKVPLVPVSAQSGDGIEELKSLIIDLLSRISPGLSGRSAYICIDRVFSIKGSGTVITGSLSGGNLSVGQELSFLPGGKTSKVRAIQSYYSSIETAHPVSRVACNLQGIKKDDLSRGSIAAIHPEDFYCEKEYIIRWERIAEQKEAIKNHMELEIAAGTGHYLGMIHILENRNYARIVLEDPAAAGWLDPCLLIRHGGSKILAKGRIIWAGETDRFFRKRLSQVLENYPAPEIVTSLTVFKLVLNGWVELTTTHMRKEVEDFSAAAKISVRFSDANAILEEHLKSEMNRLHDLASRPGGISRAEFQQAANFPENVTAAVIEESLQQTRVIQKGQIFLSAGESESVQALTPLGKKLLAMLSQNKKEGLELKSIKEPGAQKELRNLVRIGEAVPLEDGIYYKKETFDTLAAAVLKGLKQGSSFSIPEAKEKTGLSRKYIIPLLNKMEETGLVKREDNIRIVC